MPITVDKKEMNGVTHVKLKGVFNEKGSDLAELIGYPERELWVTCNEVESFNSIGVKKWIDYFTKLRHKGVKLKFIGCSSSIVAHVGMIVNVVLPEEIVSVAVPYSCTQCKSNHAKVFEMNDLKSMNFKLPEVPCPKCKTPMELDELPDEYIQTLLG